MYKKIKIITQLYFLITGFLLFLYLIITKGFYRGSQIFYRKTQGGGYLGHVSKQFITFQSLGELFLNWKIFISEYENPRISKIAISQYSSRSLGGYGLKNYSKLGTGSLLKQQRGLIIPFMTDFCNNAKKNIRMCEIGCGNGDVTFYLSKKFKHIKFIGIDFIVDNAREKYPTNVRWIKGYSLDTIKKILPDAVYSSSTWVIFTPRELESYLNELKKYGCRNIFISEPLWGPKYFYNETKVESFHLEAAIWLHKWPAYFKKYGYSLKNSEIIKYKHQFSQRPDIRTFKGHWILQKT